MKKQVKELLRNEILIIPLLATILTLILTWPLALHLNSYFPQSGDGMLQTWIMWYNQQALLSGILFDHTAYFNAPQYYPLPYTLAYADHRILLTFLFAPIYWMTYNLSLAANIVALSLFVATFSSSYYVCKKLTKNIQASIIGAFIFTFNPITFAHFQVGHNNLLTKCFLPLVFYFSYRWVTTPTWKNSFYFFLFFTLNALSTAYFEIFSLLSLPVFLIPFVIAKSIKINFRRLFRTMVLGVFFLPILWYFNMPYLQFSRLEGITRSISESIFFSAQPIDLISSLPINLVYGPFVHNLHSTNPSQLPGGIEFYFGHTLSFNLIPLFLAIIGIKFMKKTWKTKEQKYLFIGLVSLFIFSFVMMFGPYWANQTELRLPYYYLYTHLPLLQGIRAPGRFEFITYFPFALFAAYGMVQVLKTYKTQGMTIFFVFLVLLLLENYNFTNYQNKSHVYEQASTYHGNKAIHNILDGTRVIHFPHAEPYSDGVGASGYLMWSTFFNTTTMNGNSGYQPPEVLQFLRQIDLSQQEDLKALQAVGIQNIIVHKDRLSKVQQLNLKTIPEQARMYDDAQISIISLNKLPFYTTGCDRSTLDYTVVSSQDSEPFKTTQELISITNKSNCYVVSRYHERYEPVRIPFVIYPNASFTLQRQQPKKAIIPQAE